jgi:8-oxo-dGTP pyrophosphatase MutT (NUDIX family)
MNKETSAGAIIFRRAEGDHLYLVIYSSRNKIWGFPKGHVEPGENEKSAALREIEEETGLTDFRIIIGYRYEDVYKAMSNRGEFKGQEIEKHSIYFLFETRSENVLVDNHEIGDFKWLRLQDALGILTFDSTKEILKAADKYLTAEKKS